LFRSHARHTIDTSFATLYLRMAASRLVKRPTYLTWAAI